jgi:hypothetical protein
MIWSVLLRQQSCTLTLLSQLVRLPKKLRNDLTNVASTELD